MGVTRYMSGFQTDDFQNRELDCMFTAIRENVLTSIHISPKDKHRSRKRKIMGVTLPWYYDGACELKPDDNDLASIIDGAKHRVGGRVPPIDRRILRRFKRYTALWIRANLKPLDGLTTIDLESWLESTNYPESRKEQLRKCYTIENEKFVRPKFEELKSFIKDEFYQEPKAFRTINSRDDYYKCILGPWIHAIEKEVFKHEDFIKTIPVADRARAVHNKYQEGMHIATTDCTAWEASMGRDIMKAVEFELFKVMSKYIPGHKEFLDCYYKLVFQNKLKFNGLVVTVISRRMSGEMSTSVGNGFTNLMMLRFTCYIYGITAFIFVEGDDGIVFSDKPLPEDIFRGLGFIIKLERHNDIRKAKFCSLLFDNEFNLVRDPIHSILRLGWTSQLYVNSGRRVHMNLLRLKAISLKCEVPNAPILGVLADRILELTKAYSRGLSSFLRTAKVSLYERERYDTAIKNKVWGQRSKVTSDARLLVEEEFGIHWESQLMIEESINKMDLDAFSNPILDAYIKNDHKVYFERYTNTDKNFSIVCDTRRDCLYQTFLPNNPISDSRYGVPMYAA